MKRALTTGVAVAVAALLAVGCSKVGSDTPTANRTALPADMAKCSDIFVTGKTVERKAFGQACKGDNDQLVVPLPVKLDCTDGRVLLWNDYAWGYVDDQMTVFSSSDTQRQPVDEATKCLENSGATGRTTTTAAH
jgi:hypothetical protein